MSPWDLIITSFIKDKSQINWIKIDPERRQFDWASIKVFCVKIVAYYFQLAFIRVCSMLETHFDERPNFRKYYILNKFEILSSGIGKLRLYFNGNDASVRLRRNWPFKKQLFLCRFFSWTKSAWYYQKKTNELKY